MHCCNTKAVFTALAISFLAAAQSLTAQQTSRPTMPPQPPPAQGEKQFAVRYVPSARFDLIAGSTTAGQLGAGLSVPFSNYFAVGGTLGAGISETGFSARGDLFTRFSLDPYRQFPWEPYFGVGSTTRLDTGGPGTRTYLLGFFGFNGPKTGKVAPGVEVGVGGGIRLGVTLRWAE